MMLTMTTINGDKQQPTRSEAIELEPLAMEVEGTKSRFASRRAIMMGGVPILLFFGLLQLTAPSTIDKQVVVLHDSLRGPGWTSYGELEALDSSKTAGFWANLLDRLGFRSEEELNDDETDDFRYLSPSGFESEFNKLFEEAKWKKENMSHRRLQVTGSSLQLQAQAQQQQAAPAARPIIYTFYAPIEGANKGTGMSDSADQKLLQAWKEEWTRHGWDPRIIGLETAQQHPDFVRLNGILSTSLQQMKTYDRYCFLRYLAMSVVSGGWMSDYDTFPLHAFNASILPNEGRLTVHEYSKNGGVPDLVSGSAQEFNRMAGILVENAFNHRSERFWSDMFALHDLYVSSGGSIYIRDSHVMPGQVITRQTRSDKICKRTNGKYAVHFSHFAMEFGGTAGAGPEHRADFAQTWLKQWRELCLPAVAVVSGQTASG
jgi:hypothetical protein